MLPAMSWAQSAITWVVPLMWGTQMPQQEGFLRLVNYGSDAGVPTPETIRIEGYDGETGRYLGEQTIRIGAYSARHVNSGDLARANPQKGLSGTAFGDRRVLWLKVISPQGGVFPHLYSRTPDGFLTAMLPHYESVVFGGDGHSIFIGTFNPGSNTTQVSVLALLNDRSRTIRVSVFGVDDGGNAVSRCYINLEPRRVFNADAVDLESQCIGDGDGKWRLVMEGTAPFRAMSLLYSSTTQRWTNLTVGGFQQESMEVLGSPLLGGSVRRFLLNQSAPAARPFGAPAISPLMRYPESD